MFFDYSYLPRERDWSRSPGVQALTRKAYESADDYKALLANFAAYRAKFARRARSKIMA